MRDLPAANAALLDDIALGLNPEIAPSLYRRLLAPEGVDCE